MKLEGKTFRSTAIRCDPGEGEMVRGCCFVDCEIENCFYDTLSLQGCEFQRCEFYWLTASNIDVSDCRFIECVFLGIDLKEINLTDVVLHKCTFRRDNLGAPCELPDNVIGAINNSNSKIEDTMEIWPGMGRP